jgi:ribulose-5-phosphate 4-epimerase/fuculose-1-phosphate aldolase
MPIPLVAENTSFIDAGPLTLALERRVVNEATIAATYGESELVSSAITDHLGKTGTSRTQIDLAGLSIHVLDAERVEHLRFDCFDDDPHYHYLRPDENWQTVCEYDAAANGDMLDWVMALLRDRLRPVLAEIGASHLEAAIDDTALNEGLDELDRLVNALRQSVDSAPAVGRRSTPAADADKNLDHLLRDFDNLESARLSPAAQLALLARTLFHEGYDEHTAGHISYRTPTGDLLVTPDLAWDEVRASDILEMSPAGEVIKGNRPVPPGIPVHFELHARRPDVGVVVHNHPQWATVWAGIGRVPDVYDQLSAMIVEEPIFVDEYPGAPASEGTGARIAELVGSANLVLLANHGVLVAGRTIEEAHLRCISLERRCSLAWRVEAIGKGRPMDRAASKALATFVDTRYGGWPGVFAAMCRREIRRDPSVLS